MEQLRIAQFYNNYNKCEILENVDVNYCIPDSLPVKGKVRNWSGYTSLHFAANRMDLYLTNKLIEQGADLVKQGTRDGCTPLLAAVEATSFTNKPLYEMFGQLQDYSMINVLLTRQVEYNKILNPSNKNGVSHLHIASIVNHAEAVEFFSKAKEPLDQPINCDVHWLPGYTPLHCAVKYSSVEAAEILLKYGADINIKNAKGMSCMHLLVERIMNLTDYITMGTRKLCMPCIEEIGRIESIIELVLKANNKVFTDDIGLSALHVACTLRNKSKLKDILKEDIDVNMPIRSESIIWPGWTPVHFAACFNVETMILLIQNGANIMLKNSKGESALDLCAQRFYTADIKFVLSTKNEFKDIVLSDRCTNLLDLLLIMNDYGKFSDFLQEVKDVNLIIPFNSPIWPGYNLLHLSVCLNERTKQWNELERNSNLLKIVEDVLKRYNCTEEEEALYWKRIELCLKCNCSVSMKNANGQTPIHIAFNMLRETTVEKLLSCSEDNVTDRDGLSHLHIACMVGHLEAVKMYLNGGADVNSRIKVSFNWHEKWYQTQISKTVRENSTPLHMAVMFGYATLVEYLLENKADVYAKDSLDLTPIHLIMSARKEPRRLAELLFKASPNLRDSVSKGGMSHLHVAAYADDQEAVKQMLLEGAEIDNVVEANVKHPPFLARLSGQTPLHVALKEDSDKAVKALLNGGANVYAKDLQGISALQYSLHQSGDISTKRLIRKLKNGKYDVESSGMTLLHVACAHYDIKWVKKLLKKGADVNARILVEGRLRGATPLYVLVNDACFADVSNPQSYLNLVQLLINNGADVTIKCSGSTPLHRIYEHVYADYLLEESDEEYIYELRFLLHAADLLLKSQKSYDINPVNCQGFSHFHFACIRNDVQTVCKFLNNGVDINESTDPFAGKSEADGFTPLHFALAHHSKAVAYLLLERGANIDAEDVNGNKPLHAAIKGKFVDLPLIQTMLSCGADIHAKNLSDETLLYCLLRSAGLTLEGLEFFLNHGCSINILETSDSFDQGIIGLAMRNAAPTELQSILERLMHVCEVKNAVRNGFNVIQSIVAVDEIGELTFDDYLSAIEFLMGLGCELDQQNAEGKTALHEAASFYNLEAVDALLQVGADVNVINNVNECPFSDKMITATTFHDLREMDVVEALSRHIWKMRFTGLDVHYSNLRCLEKAEKKISLASLLEQPCQDEWKKAKETKICECLTVKDFLSELGAVAEYPRMSPIRRTIVDKFFQRTTDLRREFPEFCGLLSLQYRKTLARMDLWQPVKEIIALICQVELPDLCLEAISRYFTTNEMKDIIELGKEIHNYF